MNPLATLRRRFAVALAPLTDQPIESDAVGKLTEMVLPSQDAKFGDYQANCAMPLGKRLEKKPREVAESLVDALDVADLCEPPEIAGPGFINLRLRNDWLAERVAAASADADRLGVSSVESPRAVVVDFSSPNVAKPMHVGHVRSTVIGAALCRVLGFIGHRVTSDNHIGDWGTQFGMIIYGYKHFADEPSLAEAPVAELSRLYKLVNQIGDYQSAKADKLPALVEKLAAAKVRAEELSMVTLTGNDKQDKKALKEQRRAEAAVAGLGKEIGSVEAQVAAFEADAGLSKLAADHPAIGAAALRETAKLHAGDAENRGLWDRFLPACLEEINATYRRLGVAFDHTLGESFYQPMLAGVVDDLTAKGLATESEGAVCVFPDKVGLEGHAAPFIVRKQDGAFLYSTTDLATIQYRLREWRPDAILYVVDHRQSLHFEQLFATAKAWGIDGVEELELMHVAFGAVLGEDGKPYKTRSGSAVGLVGLLDEAVDRARAIADGSPMLETDAERRRVAERIGIGAIKYADLSHNRTSDYVFDYDKMLAMTGNTAAYMQNSYARVRSIFRKAGVEAESVRAGNTRVLLDSPAERALAVAIIRFSEALDRVAADYRPNHLAAYLFELASCYSEFFEKCHVLRAESEELKQSRLVLCDLTARTIAKGLELLGIETVERM
ncbi:MAG: arginine--tRNA ligase [Planctomycetota bacterium]